MTKQEAKDRAVAHYSYIKEKYAVEIKEQIHNTKIYNCGSLTHLAPNRVVKPSFTLVDEDAVSVVLRETRGKVCVLNFASYKYPGGYFLSGSLAQEEALCHESTLFPVLKAFEGSYYAWNRRNMNRALYKNRALYTPEVLFLRDSSFVEADVLTCAAPNYGTARRYQHVTKEENRKEFSYRVNFMYAVAAKEKVDTLILGAWGCGVFKQDPVETCKLLTGIALANKHFGFQNIIFAIPNSGSSNYKAFKETLERSRV